ncbi:transposase [Streptomyces sp. NPDC002671]
MRDSGPPRLQAGAAVSCRAGHADRWWPEIAAFIDTGHSNAESEGINRVIKLVARNASEGRGPSFGHRPSACAPVRRPARPPAPGPGSRPAPPASCPA